MLAMAAISKHYTANLLQIYKRIANLQISAEYSINTNTYFLSYIDKIPDTNFKTSSSLTEIQKKVIQKHNLGVYIPKNFKSIIETKDKEPFIFYNSIDSSLMLAKCFDFNDTILKQIERSTKYDSPIYGPDYNDLSEFQHFKLCEKIITDSLIGPFYFGGTLYDLLGAENIMHHFFLPKSKKYQFGEFSILYDKAKYLFIVSLHNRFREDLNEKARWQAFRFNGRK
jgi:hypothetical protein